MKYKADWPAAKERLTALWYGKDAERPALAVMAPSGRNVKGPGSPATPEQKWADPRWLVQAARATMESTWWGGEAIPSSLLMCGWFCCLGGTPRMDMRTIWFEHMEVDFDSAPAFRFDPTNPWVRQYEQCYLAMAEAAGRDDFLLGQPCILPANDLLSMLMGTENFLIALHDHPQWIAEAIRQGAAVQAEARSYFQRLLQPRHEFWYGIGGWMPFWAPQPFMSTQSDVSCMLSPEMYDRFVVPELELYSRKMGPLWYHLDGGDARQHLPRLLSLPYLRVLQYTPAPCEPSNGLDHLPMYRKVQAAGKIVHIHLPKENVLGTAKALDKRLLMMQTGVASIAEGEQLLAELRNV